MDIETFIKNEKPKSKQSRLLPFKDGIFKLHIEQYTHIQIAQWVTLNGLVVCRKDIWTFIDKNFSDKQKIKKPAPPGLLENKTMPPVTKAPAEVKKYISPNAMRKIRESINLDDYS